MINAKVNKLKSQLQFGRVGNKFGRVDSGPVGYKLGELVKLVGRVGNWAS